MERDSFITNVCAILKTKPTTEQVLALVDLYSSIEVRPRKPRAKARYFNKEEEAYMLTNRGLVKHKDMAIHLGCTFRQVTNYFYFVDNP